jgi:RNA 2',3'-cyclic 3'-phosphodiesterase
VADGERIRLFCALQLPVETRDGLAAWASAHIPESAGRLVPADNLHVTLAFLGSQPADEVPAIARELGAASESAAPIELRPRRYRETRSVGMLVLHDAEGRATALARDLHARLEQLGVYEREKRPWLPHATVVRFRRPPRLRPRLPALGEVSPSEAAVYHSLLRRGGAQYVALETVRLGGG